MHGDKKAGELKKVDAQKPHARRSAPPGAIVLFDGTSPDNFENGKLIEGNLLGATGCVSKHKFGDHSLHIEFRTPFMPKSRGQARGNSGVYVQGRYEVQVLDSFGLEGEDNECGGIYKIAKPAVNMCFPPLSWQTYDIDFKAARYDDGGKKTDNARITDQAQRRHDPRQPGTESRHARLQARRPRKARPVPAEPRQPGRLSQHLGR